MNCRHKLFTAALAGFVLIGSMLIYSFMAKRILASTGDDEHTLTQIVMDQDGITGLTQRALHWRIGGWPTQ